MRELVEAPVDGYSMKELPLYFESTKDPERFYYFRRGNQYGRICVLGASCSVGKTHFLLRFYVITNTEENPDMKRRLRSDSDKIY
ncbi:hypothetical protein SDC9_177373 [bioreactor metagenome]|uniref:Uncharacterized protein n=1 Tax=bioreactor metagenome TaxID=1076179 RepID=A0A645GSU7_9ZZZZ